MCNCNERYHPTPHPPCVQVQQQTKVQDVASTMCASATNVIIPPPPPPLCASATTKGQDVASTMCASATVMNVKMAITTGAVFTP